MSTYDLIPQLIVPSIADSEDADIQFYGKSFRQEGDQSRFNGKFKGIFLTICSHYVLTSGIEGLALLVGASEKKVSKHGNSL